MLPLGLLPKSYVEYEIDILIIQFIIKNVNRYLQIF